MEFLSDGAIWGALFSIIVANILLSGDNAVIIALAARSLPADQAKKAIFWGSAAAIIMRVVLTLVAVKLLGLPYLKIIGGILLLYIGIQLMMQGDDEEDVKAHGSLGAAIRTILVADLVMSVDNVVAVAAAADKAPENARIWLTIIGLAMSIPLIIAGSTMLLKVMERFPIIITLGAALLGWLAGSMFVTDPAVAGWFSKNVANAEMMAGGLGAVLVVVVGLWLVKRSAKKELASTK